MHVALVFSLVTFSRWYFLSSENNYFYWRQNDICQQIKGPIILCASEGATASSQFVKFAAHESYTRHINYTENLFFSSTKHIILTFFLYNIYANAFKT